MDLDGGPNDIGRKLITSRAKVRMTPLTGILLSLIGDYFYMHVMIHIRKKYANPIFLKNRNILMIIDNNYSHLIYSVLIKLSVRSTGAITTKV
jgi:hypothetical protein